MIREEVVQLDALSEVFNSLKTSNVFKEIEVSVNIDACTDKSMPVNALKLNISVIFLELELDGFSEVNIWPLDGVHVLTSHLELIEVEVLWEDLHI